MKVNLSRMLRSGVAMLLVLFMIVGFIPTAAFAADAGEKINYVSIGDSMANGYGFVGYEQNSDDRNVYDFMTGKGMYGNGAYPIQFEKYLTGLDYDVNHTKLATSAMLAEDLLYLLGGREEFDDGWSGYKDYIGTYTDAEISAHIQKAVTNADVITMGIGNAAFGAYLMDKVTGCLGIMGAEPQPSPVKFEDAIAVLELDAEQYALAMQVYGMVESKLISNVPVDLVEEFNLEAVVDIMAYTAASYIVNYKLLVEKMLEMNSDVEIVLVGLLNTTYGMNIVDDGEVVLPFGDVMDSLFGMLNAYMAGLPAVLQAQGVAPEAKLYYAEQPAPDFICMSFDDLYEAGWADTDNGRLSGKTVRSRTIKSYSGFLRPVIAPALGMDLPAVELEDVANYEFAAPDANGVEQYNIAVQVATQMAQFDSTNTDELPLVARLLTYFQQHNIEVDFNNPDAVMAAVAAAVPVVFKAEIEKEISIAIYLGLEESLVYSVDTMDLSLDGLMGIAGDIFGTLGEMPEALNPANNPAPKTIKNALVQWFTGSKTGRAMCKVFAMFKVGDGMSVHPTPTGHDNIAAAVIGAYANQHTVKDETIKNVNIVLNELYKLVETYGPEVAAQVWAQWEEYGYVDAVWTSMKGLKTQLAERYTYYTESALPAITAAIENLSAQKDTMVAELTALKAELAAKKAELADVMNNVEISSIHTPDINIDVELGNNEQTQIPENDCTVDGEDIKTELEAAVKDLEHTIATIEALIADIQADIADVVALAEQIAAAVAELEKTMTDVAAAAEDLEKAINDVINVVKNSNGVVNQVVSSFQAARDTAQAAVEVLTLTIGTAEEMMADVDIMIEKIATDAEELYNKFMAELPGCIDQIPEEAKMLIAGSVYAAQQAYEANKGEIEAALAAELAKLAEEYGINEESVKAELAKLAREYETNKAADEAELAEIEAKITEEVNAKYAEIEAEYNAQIEAAKTEANAKLAELEAELKGYQAELEALAADAAEEVRTELQRQIDRVNADIATVNADLEHAVAHLENAAQEAYEQIVTEVTKVYEETIAALEQKLAELKETYDEAVAALNEKLAEMKEAYDKAVEDLTDEADKAIAELTETLNKQLEELGKIGEELAGEVNGILTTIREELSNAQKAVEEILKGNLAAIGELKNTLVKMGGKAIIDAVEALNDAVMVLIEEATTADLVIDDDFKYVAIGDGSAAPESYVEKLTAALNAEAAENGVDEIEMVNYAKVGNTVAAERANLSDVTGADLITVGFSNVEFLSKAIANAGSGAQMDWAAVVGEENVQYVDQLLAEVAAKIAEAGIEGESAVMANAAIEAYAYAAALYATELPELVSDIHAANAEALVIIIGMYNPMKGVTIALDANTTLDIGEYVDYLVKGVGVHGVAYSILTGNSIYVDAPDVQTVNTDTELGLMDMLNLILTGYASLYPSAAGDDYIAAEIADALNIICNKMEVTTDFIEDTGRTLSLEGVIYINQYVKVHGFEDVDPAADGGLLIWTSEVAAENATYENAESVVEGLFKVGNEYAQQTHGIAAKEYADTLYLRVYLKMADGTYVYSDLKEFSVRTYCEGIINRNSNEYLKDTCIDMLYYGAAAQTYFGYNVNDLANKNIVQDHPATAWDETLLTPVTDFDTNVTASANVVSNGKTLSLDGAVATNYYFKVNDITAESAELLVWDGVTDKLTLDNVTYTKDMVKGNGEYGGQANPFAAKEYSKTVYVCAHFVDSDGNDHHSEVIAFSPEAYAENRIENSSNANLVALMKRMVVYGESARIYFANK